MADRLLDEEHDKAVALELLRAVRSIDEAIVQFGGGNVVAVWGERENWTMGAEFGREAPDSDMAGGAAYAIQDRLVDGLLRLAEEIKK